MHEPRNQSKDLQEQVRDGEAVMRKIEQMREALYPQHTSGNRSKWEQYLPGPEMSYHFASLSKDEQKMDQYRHSLERKLERLFKEERDLLKQRHFGDSLCASKQKSMLKGEAKGQHKAEMRTSSSVENMERKIRQLEERYRGEVERKKEKQRYAKQSSPIVVEEKPKYQVEPTTNIYRQKIKSEFVSSKQSEPQRQRSLSLEVDELKRAITQLKQSNEQLLNRMAQRDEKKRHKRRTKEILLAILHKLEFINAEVATGKRGAKHQGLVKAQRQRTELMRQFEGLRQQYLRLDQERKKLEAKQEQIQRKMNTITQGQ